MSYTILLAAIGTKPTPLLVIQQTRTTKLKNSGIKNWSRSTNVDITNLAAEKVIITVQKSNIFLSNKIRRKFL